MSDKEEIEVTSDDPDEHGHLVVHSHGDRDPVGGAFNDPHPLGQLNCDSSNCDVATHGVFQLNCDITVDGHLYEKGTVTTARLSDVVAIGELTLNSLHTNLSQEALDSDMMRCYNTCHIQTSTPGSPAEPPPPTLVPEDEDEDDSLCVTPPCPPEWLEIDGCCYENTAAPCTPGVDCEDEVLIETEDPPDPDPPDPGTPPPDPIDCPGGPAVPEDEFTVTGTGGSAVATGANECLVFNAMHHTCAYLDYLVFDDCNVAIITIENLNDFPQYKEGAWVLVRGVAEIVTGVYPIFDVTATGFKIGPRNEGRTPLSGEVIQPPEGNSANSFHVMTFTSNLLTDGEFTGGEIGGWTVDQPQRIDHQTLELGKFATGGWDNPAGAPPDYYDIVAQQDVYLDQNKTYRIQFVGDATVWANTDITGTQSNGSDFTVASGANWAASLSATATVTFTGQPSFSYDQTIVIEDGDGLSKTYTAKGSSDFGDGFFGIGHAGAPNTVAQIAEELKGCIEHANGHDGSITVVRTEGVLELTQVTTGSGGNNIITEDLDNCTVTGFTGGDTMAEDEWPLISVPVSGTFTIYVKTYSDDPNAATPYAYFLDRIHIVECSV